MRRAGTVGAGAASSEAGGVATPAECVSVCVVCEREGEANSDKLQMTGFAECQTGGHTTKLCFAECFRSTLGKMISKKYFICSLSFLHYILKIGSNIL